MKSRNTLLLAIIFGSLLAYVWLVESRQSSTREREQTSKRVLSFERDKIDSVSVRNDASRMEFFKKEGVWTMTQPLQDRADTAAVEQLLELLEFLQHDSKIELNKETEAAQLKEFGLAESALAVGIGSENGKKLELSFGKDSAVEGKVYVRLQGKPTVHVVRDVLRKELTQTTDHFRDHRLSATPVQAVQKLAIKTNEGEIELERKNQHWEILRPLRARAADARVGDLLAAALTARVHQFLSEKPTPEQGLTEPRATLFLQVEGQKEPTVLVVGAAPPDGNNKDKSYAKLSSRAAVTLVSNSALDPLLKARPNDLRDRKLIRVEEDIVDRISIEAEGGASLVLARKGEGWVRKEGENESPVREGLANALLKNLQGAEAVKFVSDIAADLGKYGLAQPRLKVRLSSYSSENTAETRAGEKPIVTLLLGMEEGGAIYAKLEEEPFILSVSKSLVESIPKDRSALEPLPEAEAVHVFTPEQVIRIETADGAGGVERFEKTDGAWKVSGGTTPADSAAVDSLLKHLSNLRAPRKEAGSMAPTAGDGKPAIEVTLGLQSEGKGREVRYSVGAQNREGFFPTTVSSKTGVYLLRPADKEALMKKLAPTP
jgi:hypothetical protein